MNQFSIDRAWSLGFDFLTRRLPEHAMVLIGIGIVIPVVLQLVLTGGLIQYSNPVGQLGAAGMAGGSGIGVALLVTAFSYALQVGSYFASWRLGLAPEENVGGAVA